MTGANAFQRYKKIIPKKKFLSWLDSLKKGFRLIGPVQRGNQTVFKEVNSPKELHMEYYTTMLPPGKLFLYKPIEELLNFRFNEDILTDHASPSSEKQLIVGVHPCDTHAIIYLDRTFMGIYKDYLYEARRKNSVIISLNCMNVSPNCFCSSVGTGPFFNGDKGCDILLTDFGDSYLVEIKSLTGADLFTLNGKKIGSKELKIKKDMEKSMLDKFYKKIKIDGLDRLFIENIDHPVWERTAEERCLSCSNCVMVCPTCFCYDIVDETSIDLKTARRIRQLDACQDLRFAEVHGGNFRQQRAARLRQFVTHKMNQTHQYGLLGTVGCGRCITWCPTGIDLTDITKEIQMS